MFSGTPLQRSGQRDTMRLAGEGWSSCGHAWNRGPLSNVVLTSDAPPHALAAAASPSPPAAAQTLLHILHRRPHPPTTVTPLPVLR